MLQASQVKQNTLQCLVLNQQYRCHAVYIVDVLVFTRVFTLLELLVSMGSVVVVSSFVVSDLLV